MEGTTLQVMMCIMHKIMQSGHLHDYPFNRTTSCAYYVHNDAKYSLTDYVYTIIKYSAYTVQ